ncbi:AtpZ/AtpI family protein [Motilibacter rhizosphaerae]|uniref:AtpZ/AtpI family protein n=1 Tax=Motilibacter rhizosphaerae TaxID=598652 RepID=UPI001E57D35F|nr:hypothetical protein [Motilibacter rhizosphaerae]
MRPGHAVAPRSDDGWGVLSYLLTGVFLWGGLGWLGDDLLGTAFLLPVGLVLGAALAVYTVYVRFGRDPLSTPECGTRPEAQEGRR